MDSGSTDTADSGEGKRCSLIGAQDLLKLHDVVLLVCIDQVGHSQHLPIVLVRLGLLSIKGVHAALHQHVGQHQILETLYSPHRTSFIVVFERLSEEACQRFWKASASGSREPRHAWGVHILAACPQLQVGDHTVQ